MSTLADLSKNTTTLQQQKENGHTMFQSKADSVQLLEDALSVLDIPEGPIGDLGTK